MYHVEILFFLRLAHRLSLISYYTFLIPPSHFTPYRCTFSLNWNSNVPKIMAVL